MQQPPLHQGADPQATIVIAKQPVGLEPGRKRIRPNFEILSFVIPVCWAIRSPQSSLSSSAWIRCAGLGMGLSFGGPGYHRDTPFIALLRDCLRYPHIAGSH